MINFQMQYQQFFLQHVQNKNLTRLFFYIYGKEKVFRIYDMK